MRLAFALLLLAGCSVEGTLIVQVRTDLTPGSRFDSITVTATGEGVNRDAERLAGDATEWSRGVRVAEFDALPAGSYRLSVSALDAAGAIVVARPVRVELEGGTRVVTVLLTRDCSGVVCPGAGDPSAVACLGGRCVQEGCTEETPELCPMPACTMDGECAATSECTVAECSPSGTCFQALDPMVCGAGAACDVNRGCVTPEACTEWNVMVSQPGEAGPSAGEDVTNVGSSILVVWSQAGAGIHISPRDPLTGTEIVAQPALAASGSLTQITPAPPGAFVSWANGTSLDATAVDATGTAMGTTTLTTARGASDDWAATTTAGGILVSWSDTRSSPVIRHGLTSMGTLDGWIETSVEAQWISHVDVGSGSLLACFESIGSGIRCDRVDASDAASIMIGFELIVGGTSARPSAALGPADDVGVAYDDGSAIRLAVADRDGVFDVTRSRFVVADVTSAGPPSLAFDGTHYAVAYAQGGVLEVVTWVAPNAATDLHRYADTGRVTNPPRIIAHASGFYVVYRAEGSSDTTQNVYLRKMCVPADPAG